MIVCKQCGHRNEDNDTFCGSCGKFLEWTGERVVVAEPEPEPEPPAPEPVAQPAHLGLIDRVKQAVGIEETAPQAAAAVETPSPALPARGREEAVPVRTVPVTSAPPTAPFAPGVPVSPAASVAPPPAAPAAAPVAAPAPVLVGVGAPASPPPPPAQAVQPDEPISRRPTSVAPAVPRPRPGPRVLEPPTRRHPGDLICGQCGEGNDPVRHFCRRCGNALDEALVVRLPWWRRFLNRVFGVRTREAGWRPHRVGPPNVMGMFWRIVRLAIVALVIVGALAFLLVPAFHDAVTTRVTSAVTTVRKALFPHYDAVFATGASASTATAGHLPPLAIDKFLNTYWAAAPGDHTPFIKLSFPDPVDLAEIGFDSGASGGGSPVDSFLGQPRPHLVHLVFSDGTATDLTLKDEDPAVAKNAQFYPITAKQVTFVEIHIMSVYPTAGAAPSSVAISEVEFRIKD